MAGATKPIIDASRFLGSHAARQLAECGERVRVSLHRISSTVAIGDLDVEWHYEDVIDDEALRTAMDGCDDVATDLPLAPKTVPFI
jgi:dihydroflavonol-4-reductase